MSNVRRLILVSILVSMILVAPAALAQVVSGGGQSVALPTNDARAGAADVTIPSSTRGTNAASTLDAGEPQPCAAIGTSVWFRIAPAASGWITVDTFGSNFDTVLAAYPAGNDTAVACNDQSGGSQSMVRFHVDANATYDLQLAGWTGAKGSYVLNVGPVDSTPPALPDLVASAVRATQPIGVGQNVTIAATIVNDANVNAAAGFVVAWRVDGVTTFRESWPPGMPAHYNLTVKMTHQFATTGPHLVEMIADADGSIDESNESNNVAAATFDVGNVSGPPSGADLAVSDVRGPSNVSQGQVVTVFATIRNLGDVRGPTNFTVAFLVDGNVVATQWWPPSIPAGYNLTVATGIRFNSSGPHVVKVVADWFQVMPETDESNNAAERTFFVQPAAQASVHITSLERVPLSTEAGDVRHPLARWQATIQICDEVTDAVDVSTQLFVEAGNGRASELATQGAQSLPSLYDPIVRASACSTHTIRFDTPGVIGDFRLTARLVADNDFSPADDFDQRAGFNLVEEEGGIVAPDGVRPA